MTITTSVNAIKDYQTCARLYDYRYNNQVYEPTDNEKLIDERYSNVMKNILTFLFHKKQSGTPPTFDFMIKKWQKLWFPKDITVQKIMTMTNDASNKHNISNGSSIGVRALQNVYEHFENIDAIPLLVQEKFIVSLTKGVRLEGEFDLVLKYKDYDHVIKWGSNLTRTPTSNLLLDFAALKYAYEYRNSGKKLGPVKYSFIDLALPKFNQTDFDIPLEDIQSLKYWSEALRDDQVFMPRRGLTTHCSVCAFDIPCSKFKIVS
jgi:hypothetical protein